MGRAQDLYTRLFHGYSGWCDLRLRLWPPSKVPSIHTCSISDFKGLRLNY